MSLTFQPLYDKIEIMPNEEAQSASGIILVSSDKKPEIGTVVSVGGGRVLHNGTLMPLEVKVGDSVVFRKYAADVIEISGVKSFFIQESDILAIIKQ